jgi:TM2 domain-containing membrane protein YozV
MDCVNHSGTSASAYCQNCGKALCSGCVRNAAGGQILCEPCLISWQSYQQPFAAPDNGPNPTAAAVLGLIPGVGAMYNGQFFKGLLHVVIFAVLISITDHFPIFGLFIAAWVLYQAFEAYHTARARRAGEPLPDPLGLNEVGNWFNLGAKQPPYPPQPGSAQPNPSQGAATGGYQQPYQAPYQPYRTPYAPPAAEYVESGFPPVPPIPPIPPVPPIYWRRKEPIGAVVLIALGLLFLMGQMNIFSGRLIAFSWPLALIALGVWLIVRRLGDAQGVSK